MNTESKPLNAAFEKWWQEEGQYCRAGGSDYEKTFAYRAFEAALAGKSTVSVDRWKRDSELLEAIQDGCWDVRFLSSSNGDAGDYNIGIEIVAHFMEKPQERVIGEDWNENLRTALEQAMTAEAYPPARPAPTSHPIPTGATGDRDWELACDECNGSGHVFVKHQVAERKTDVQEFKEECEACEGRGFNIAFEDIPGIADYVKSCGSDAGVTGEDEQSAFERWLERTCPSGDVESVQRQWEASSDYADFHAPAAGDVQGVPAEVMAALDRMCTPLDQSWLKGVTAEADAKCMKTIRDYILRRPACAPAAGDALVLPDLNADLIDILGKPNFTCIRIAHLLRLGGVEIAKKAEAEQATVIHYLLGFYLKHGSQWADKAHEDIEKRHAAAIAQQSQRKEA